MRFGTTAAQDALRERVRALFEEVAPSAEVRRLMETATGFEPEVWRRLAVEVDLAGLGWVELGVVLEEAGRVLLPAPLLAAASTVALVGPEADGRLATLAVAEASGRWDGSGVEARAVRAGGGGGGGWRLEGRKSYVVDGCAADLLVVAARADDEGGDVRLFLVDADGPGVTRTPLNTVDLTRKQAEVMLAAAPARPLDVPLDRAMELAAVALAAEQVGGAQRCLDMAVAHAGSRMQFGRPIGSFQAVKHLCAGMLLELESARGAAFYAASAAATADGDLPAAAAVAKACCSEAFVRVATDALHVHGGLGFTWDHDAHLYFKRARSSAQLFGDARHHRQLLARHLDL
jgi:alkylation response protein AidB-like acyl-CoA dehydrogenase